MRPYGQSAHGTKVLTNCEPPELVAERIFCAVQVKMQTIVIIRKLSF